MIELLQDEGIYQRPTVSLLFSSYTYQLACSISNEKKNTLIYDHNKNMDKSALFPSIDRFC